MTLVLSRQMEESTLILSENSKLIRVIVTDIRGDRVRLGFEADESYMILRDEIVISSLTRAIGDKKKVDELILRARQGDSNAVSEMYSVLKQYRKS